LGTSNKVFSHKFFLQTEVTPKAPKLVHLLHQKT